MRFQHGCVGKSGEPYDVGDPNLPIERIGNRDHRDSALWIGHHHELRLAALGD